MDATMSDIEWTGETWNPVRGCAKVSPGCKNCYAMRFAHRFSGEGQPYEGLTRLSPHGPEWTGKFAFAADMLDKPLRRKKPTVYFVNSMSDLFGEGVSDEQIAAVFGVMAATPQHTFQILTKRAERMREWMEWVASLNVNARVDIAAKTGLFCAGWPLPNVWLGVSVEDQKRRPRIDDLRRTPAAIRFLSLEPLLEDLGKLELNGVDWVICGGESGHGARPMHPDWARSLRDQCADAGVPFFFKQWGEWLSVTGGTRESRLEREDILQCEEVPCYIWSDNAASYRVGKRAAGRILDGRTHDGLPRGHEDLFERIAAGKKAKRKLEVTP